MVFFSIVKLSNKIVQLVGMTDSSHSVSCWLLEPYPSTEMRLLTQEEILKRFVYIGKKSSKYNFPQSTRFSQLTKEIVDNDPYLVEMLARGDIVLNGDLKLPSTDDNVSESRLDVTLGGNVK